jgi:hypothetical protein
LSRIQLQTPYKLNPVASFAKYFNLMIFVATMASFLFKVFRKTVLNCPVLILVYYSTSLKRLQVSKKWTRKVLSYPRFSIIDWLYSKY